jgi:indole-3-glycerol phosphate synthase/phosphoribosylanthranilate isomerase
MKAGILETIAEKRRRRILREGHSLGVPVPTERCQPLVAFGRSPFVICEIKRSSPSKGGIDPSLDPVRQAGLYAEAGVRSVSVLTEEDHFSGSLRDLMAVKAAYPRLSVLRKEFILDEEDLDISFRAGADAVLLIASLLDAGNLASLYEKACSLGLEALIEVHTAEDIAKTRPLIPRFTGINSRDLRCFQTDLLLPLQAAEMIDWDTRLVFESGIRRGEDVRLVRASGFQGVLIGETAVRYPERLKELVDAAETPVRATGFWKSVALRRRDHPQRPLVKICGITNREDAMLADSLGADMLGFVFADSPRRASPELLRGIGATWALKVAVVVCEDRTMGPKQLPPQVEELMREGYIDAVQFHGDEEPGECAGLAFPYYKAIRAGSEADLDAAAGYRSPRVLIDARTAGTRGGSGVRVHNELVRKAAEAGPLWLAGGISPGNVMEIVTGFNPELIDISSGIEMKPGRKDSEKMQRLFRLLTGERE